MDDNVVSGFGTNFDRTLRVRDRETKVSEAFDCHLAFCLCQRAEIRVGVDFNDLDKALWGQLDEIKRIGIDNDKLEALKNKINTAKAFQEQGLLNRSINLSFFELLGDANGVNEEGFIYQKISCNDLILYASDVLIRNNCSLLKVAINDR